jgi:F-type H+-transporting ATPase subunit c
MLPCARIVGISLAVLLVAASSLFAQQPSAGTGAVTVFETAFGVGLVVIGAAYGIGRLASAALEGMSRQPEAAGSIQVAMIITAALIEGFTFYAIYVCSTAIK